MTTLYAVAAIRMPGEDPWMWFTPTLEELREEPIRHVIRREAREHICYRYGIRVGLGVATFAFQRMHGRPVIGWATEGFRFHGRPGTYRLYGYPLMENGLPDLHVRRGGAGPERKRGEFY